MKDSFLSMNGIEIACYVVNIRGNYSLQAMEFLLAQESVIHCFRLDSASGWFYDSSKLLHFIKTPYVLLWMEDHICMAQDKINEVAAEMQKCDADILTYTYWQNGEFLKRYARLKQTSMDEISWFDHAKSNNHDVQEGSSGAGSYIVSYASIIKTTLFNRIIMDGGSEMRWPKATPFDFEKAPEDTNWLPIRRANPKYELFSSIDDDHGVIGSCLQSRGLYPKRGERQSYAKPSYKRLKLLIARLSKFPLSVLRRTKIISNMLITPAGHRLDYYRSCMQFEVDSCATLPRMTYDAIDYIGSQLDSDSRVFEYKSEDSNLYWVNYGAEVISVEHDRKCYSQVSSRMPGSTQYLLAEPEIENIQIEHDPKSPDRYHSLRFKGYSFENYVKSVDQFPEAYFDVVLIAGRARISCIRRSISKIRSGGFLILVSSDREHYLPDTSNLLAGWSEQIFHGTAPGLTQLEQCSIYIKP